MRLLRVYLRRLCAPLPSRAPRSARNILAMIGRANSISGWVTTTVLARDEPLARAEAILGCVQLLDALVELNNFHAAMAVRRGVECCVFSCAIASDILFSLF